ncbi:MAG: hypothetical protein LBD24_03125 [Spirochaetaceae bacterium]|jgi:hypothetical protein|nr:hypothetical protein [Spirochaetaceae bacterium]
MLDSKIIKGTVYKLSKSLEDQYIITYDNGGGDIEIFKTDEYKFAEDVWNVWLENNDEFNRITDVYEWLGYEAFQMNPNVPPKNKDEEL